MDRGFVSQFLKQVEDLRGSIPSSKPVVAEPERFSYNVVWQKPSANNLAAQGSRLVMDVPQARQHMYDQIEHYVQSGADYALLISAKAGLGKSTTAIMAAQALAKQGLRCLFIGPRHNYFDDIRANSKSEIHLWQHWQPTHGTTPEGELMCKYWKEARVFTSKGHSLMKQCEALCSADNHIKRCNYRKQRYTKKPIVYTVHTMLRFGIPQDFDVVFIDELFMDSLTGERFVSVRNLETGSGEPYKSLSRKLEEACLNIKGSGELRGKQLFDIIGPVLAEVYSMADEGSLPLEEEPEIYEPSDVEYARENYMQELMSSALPEFAAWRNGFDRWLSRVFLTREGLHIDRKYPLWDNAPDRVIVMDATARKSLYEQVIRKQVHVLEPPVERRGRVFQLAHKLYGISSVLDRSVEPATLTKQGEELVKLANLIQRSKPVDGGFGEYKNIGIVFYKDGAHYMEGVVNVDSGKIMWPGGSRGANIMLMDNPVDCVIVLGTPSPSDDAIKKVAAQVTLDADNPLNSRVEPFEPKVNPDGSVLPVRTSKMVEYNYVREDGLAPYRMVGGFWNHPILQDILASTREDEIVQCVHRGRILTRDCDAWIVSSVDTGEVLDGLWGDPNDALNIPAGIPWQAFLDIEEFFLSRDKVTASDLEEEFGYAKSWALRIIECWTGYYDDWKKQKDFSHKGRGRKPYMAVKA